MCFNRSVYYCSKSTKKREQFVLTGKHKEGAMDIHIRAYVQAEKRNKESSPIEERAPGKS